MLVAIALAGCVPEPAVTPAPPSTSPGSSTPAPGDDGDGATGGGETDDGAGGAASIDAAAEEYCITEGGLVQHRQPMFGTNDDPSTWTALGEPVSVCRFEAGEGESSTRIYVDPVSLYSEQPTLAALAYLAKAPMGEAAGNPAAAHCTDLGGAIAYGPSLRGGGLVDDEAPVDTVVAVCTFADGSFIDEWGIAYYSADTVRGKDLAGVFRFDQAVLPDVFPDAVG